MGSTADNGVMMKVISIPNSALRVSEISLGVMPWGTACDLDRSLALYDVYREAGGNVLDSAHLYAAWEKAIGGGGGEGQSERYLGQVVRKRGDRKDVVVVSKGGHPTFAPHYMRPDKYLAPELVK